MISIGDLNSHAITYLTKFSQAPDGNCTVSPKCIGLPDCLYKSMANTCTEADANATAMSLRNAAIQAKQNIDRDYNDSLRNLGE